MPRARANADGTPAAPEPSRRPPTPEADHVVDVGTLVRSGRVELAAERYAALKRSRAGSAGRNSGPALSIDLPADALHALEALSGAALPPAARLRELGTLHYSVGRFPDAARYFQRAASTSPSPESLVPFGKALHALGDIKGSLKAFDQALALNADAAEAHHARGMVLQAAGDSRAALESHRAAVRLDPANTSYLLELGNVEKALGHDRESVETFSRALQIDPSFPDAYNNRGLAHQSLGQFEEALSDYQRAIRANPRHLFSYLNAGIVLYKLERVDEAVRAFEIALAIDPEIPDAHYDLGLALQKLGRHREAMACFDAATAVQPKYPVAYLSKGNSLQTLERFEDAIGCYRKAIEVDPDYVDGCINWATALQELGRHEEAIAVLDQALEKRPAYAEAKWNKANSMLCFGPSEAGWKTYEQRLHLSSGMKLPDHGLPLLGEDDPAGKAILVQWDMRFGDIIQMLRYVPMLKAAARRCCWQVGAPLRDLVAASFPDLEIVGPNQSADGLDCRAPFTSLPLALRTFSDADIPAQVPYLKASDRALATWAERLPKGRPTVGLVWRGQAKPPGRNVPLDHLTPLLTRREVRVVSLQVDATAKEEETLAACSVLHLGGRLASFDDTAAVMSHLDLVISIDTAAAHLAGALARPVWVILKYGGEWRWRLERPDSPWYPTARLYRQQAVGDWSAPIRHVLEDLKRFSVGSSPAEPANQS
jgi:tetratricopeptide (TPR) repeat protein